MLNAKGACNDWRTTFHGVNDHEADWEMVSVYLAPGPDGSDRPAWVAPAVHAGRSLSAESAPRRLARHSWGSFHQLGAQALGVGVAFGCVFVVSYGIFFLLKKTIGIRVSPEEEDAGLDISEHGMYGYPEQFIPQPEYSTGLEFGAGPPPPVTAPATASVNQMSSDS